MSSKNDDLALLTMVDILSRVKGVLKIPARARHKKSALLEHVIEYASPAFLSQLRELGRRKKEARATGGKPTERRQRKRGREEDEPVMRRVAPRIDVSGPAEDADDSGRPLDEFMRLPSPEQVKACYRAFHTATSNDALRMAVCGVCARELSVRDDQVNPYPLSSLPNAERLIPSTPHPAHTLFHGKLLEPRGVSTEKGIETVNVCHECICVLRKTGTGPPKLSLANNLWIGQVPWQLQILTIPEQLLIALLYPRVYVFKLFPKNVGGGRNTETLQRAMRGNVSTYELDVEGIASMIQGHLMPHPPALLASILSVTFIGLGDLPRRWLKSTFRVRRQAIFDALRWLQENNQKYYGSITIDPERVKSLPEDDVPTEILQIIWQTDDIGIAVQESDGYVPLDTDTGTDTGPEHENSPEPESDLGESEPNGRARSCGEPAGDPSQSSRPDVIPLQISGTIDTDLTNLTADELMAWGMANLWSEGREGGYALKKAQDEEERNQPISDPAVRLLRQHIHATAGRVSASDSMRYQWCSQVWATSIALGPPSLWVTINPSDLHHPIAQIFAGEDIDMDAFLNTSGPNKEKRAKNIASDPYAASKFFHFMIHTILEVLFGITATPFQVKSQCGVLGRVSAYFGAVESQNRGSLHLHMLLWLLGSPTSAEMHELLRSPEFRQRIVVYIQANLKAHIPGIESREDIKKIPNKPDIAYSRPPHPDTPDYEARVTEFERDLVRSQQLHTCDLRRCLVPDKRGFYRCKHRAPFDLSDEDTVSESGKWKQKRKYEYLNGWMPAVLINARCNNDAKLLTNGSDTKNCTFYILGYALKKQKRHFNLSSIMAKGYICHSERSEYLDSLQDNQRLLLFRLVHTINREQELAAPMVVSYLMGWGDVYRSHRYSVVYWSSFMKAILKYYPELRRTNTLSESTSNEQGDGNITPDASRNHSADQPMNSGSENDEFSDKVSLDTDNAGRIYPKCQVTDYILRGEQLDGMNVYSFFMDTYEEDLRSKQKTSVSASVDDEDLTDMARKPGRRRNERIPYLPHHPCSQTKQRVRRTTGHNNLPNFVGYPFLRNDDPGVYSLYCASMLVLLKPWRNLETDLKAPDESWSDAFDRFLAGSPKRIRDIPPGIQYFHECRTAAEKSPEEQPSPGIRQSYTTHAVEDPVDLGEDLPPESELHTEEGLA
ncbi:hypothetical protein CERSUDRAFT_99591 [Gelatoporia subvermispora B]|uniref:Uncharacterized protein n=1 Tax=Ceriporiopsis subvermispora (strain B) TaxID=914234 RepID=M2QJ91_CERS8|nr:hypothetical protein CERSUDRAFT_99591 [Gelatoporia subvermispora B]